MGGRRRVAGGLTAWLPDHRGTDGRAFRRYVRAAVELVGPLNGSELVRAEVWRFAVAGVVFERCAVGWAEAVAKRETARGRRPSERQVERAARRLGLADATLQGALARLGSLAEARRSSGPDALHAYLATRYGAAP